MTKITSQFTASSTNPDPPTPYQPASNTTLPDKTEIFKVNPADLRNVMTIEFSFQISYFNF